MISSGHFTDKLTVFQYVVAMTGDSLVSQFDTHEFLGNAFCLLLGEGILADELFLVKFYKHAETCHDGRNLGRQFIAIKGQSYFETKGVAASQSTGLAAGTGHQFIPAFADKIGCAVDFETIFASIACAGNNNLRRNCLASIEYEFLAGNLQHFLYHGFGIWSLNS